MAHVQDGTWFFVFILIGVIEIHVLLVGIHILQLASLTGFLQILNSNGFNGFTKFHIKHIKYSENY